MDRPVGRGKTAVLPVWCRQYGRFMNHLYKEGRYLLRVFKNRFLHAGCVRFIRANEADLPLRENVIRENSRKTKILGGKKI